MTHSGSTRRLPSFLALGISFALSVLIAWFWWAKEPDAYSFRLLLGLPLHFTAAFCLIWPILTILHFAALRWKGPLAFPWIRASLALVLFGLGCYLLPSIARDDYANSDTGRRHRKQEVERAEAQLAGNIQAFQEPLTPAEEEALVHFIQYHEIDPASSTEAARHYSHTRKVLWALAGRQDASSDCLRIIYEEAVQLSAGSGQRGFSLGNMSEVLQRIGSHPNSPVDVLEQMIDSGKGWLAFRNPRLPKADKVAFLDQAATSDVASLRQMAAGDPDTPQAIMQKLTLDRDQWVRHLAEEEFVRRRQRKPSGTAN